MIEKREWEAKKEIDELSMLLDQEKVKLESFGLKYLHYLITWF